MARYVTKVRTPWSPERAFAYMADLRNFANWDPGVREVVQREGSGGGPAAVFDVTVRSKPKDLQLTYRTVEHKPPRTVLAVAKSGVYTSEDRITVVADGSGSIVTYDATLRLNGLLGAFDPVLRLVFGRIGDRAAAGLRTALDGTAA